MDDVFQKEKLEERLRQAADVAGERERELHYYAIGRDGSLQQIASGVLFVKTGRKSGFIIRPTAKENFAHFRSYPDHAPQEQIGSSFVTHHCCANTFLLEVDIPPEGPPDDKQGSGSHGSVANDG